MKQLTLVIATDGAHAKILEQKSKAEPLYLVQNLTHAHEATHEHGPDKPGCFFEKRTATHQNYKHRTDWHTHQKEIFIQDLAKLIIKRHQENEYSKIYVICPPKIMGIIRLFMDPYQRSRPLKEKINFIEITKDLTHKTIKDIEGCISKNLYSLSGLVILGLEKMV